MTATITTACRLCGSLVLRSEHRCPRCGLAQDAPCSVVGHAYDDDDLDDYNHQDEWSTWRPKCVRCFEPLDPRAQSQCSNAVPRMETDGDGEMPI
jgi:hypothetical protein